MSYTLQIGWITCDNASNNDTMMVEFARLVSKATGETYDAVRRRIRQVSSYTDMLTCMLTALQMPRTHDQPCRSGRDQDDQLVKAF